MIIFCNTKQVVTICHFSVKSVTFFHYFKDFFLLASFFEILFLTGPLTLKFAASPRAGDHCKSRLPLQPRAMDRRLS